MAKYFWIFTRGGWMAGPSVSAKKEITAVRGNRGGCRELNRSKYTELVSKPGASALRLIKSAETR
jgi:hypothetical protein